MNGGTPLAHAPPRPGACTRTPLMLSLHFPRGPLAGLLRWCPAPVLGPAHVRHDLVKLFPPFVTPSAQQCEMSLMLALTSCTSGGICLAGLLNRFEVGKWAICQYY